MMRKTINLSRMIARGESLSSLIGTRVKGRTWEGAEWVGTVSGIEYNTYVRISVNGGGWMRSGNVLTLA